jgi:16S rRNA (uracil1498-N3)-methyltransferase
VAGAHADPEIRRRAAAHVLVADVAAPALDAATEHHLFRVLRIAPGATVTVTDGAGAWRACRATASGLEPDGVALAEPQPVDPLTIAVAVPKADRPEWIVQKLTELGVDRIVMLHAERSVVRWSPERATKHLAKLRRVSVEALEQSRGVWLPVVTGPLPALDVLPTAVVAEPGGRPLRPSDRTIAIGPEGGWSPGELAAAAGTVSIGHTVLRVETAALAAAVRALALTPRGQ